MKHTLQLEQKRKSTTSQPLNILKVRSARLVDGNVLILIHMDILGNEEERAKSQFELSKIDNNGATNHLYKYLGERRHVLEAGRKIVENKPHITVYPYEFTYPSLFMVRDMFKKRRQVRCLLKKQKQSYL